MGVVIPNVLCDHPSLIGIIRMPKCTYKENIAKIPILSFTGSTWVSITQPLPLAERINSGTDESQSFSVSKSKITDFYPYSYYLLTDGECDPLLMQPQYLPTSFSIKGKYALSHQPIERYYPSNYKNSTDGTIYNITNVNQMMLPTASNEGIQYLTANANTIAQTKNKNYEDHTLNYYMMPLTSFSNGIKGLAAGVANFVQKDSDIVNNIKSANARQKDLLLTPSSISNWGNPSTRDAFNTNCVRLIKYTVKDEVKNKVENFTKRFGNKYNNYDTINHLIYKGFVKFISPDIDSGIDNLYIEKIKQILERGIFIE